MPIARFQMPDGRVARFEVPEGTTPERAQELMQGYVTQQPEQPQIEGLGRTALEQGLQGATFGFADEAMDYIGAASAKAYDATLGDNLMESQSVGDIYDEARTESQARMQRQMEQNPITSIASNIGGALVTGGAGATTKAGGALGKMLTTGGVPARIAKGAATGAVSGGTYGFGAGSGGLEERLKGAQTGAAFGAAGGGAIPAIGAGARGVAGAVMPKIDEALQPLAKRANDLGIPLSIDQLSPTKFRKTLQKVSQEAPLSGVDDFIDTQRTAFTKAVARTIGQDADNLSPQTINKFLSDANKKFSVLTKGKEIAIPQDVGSRLNALVAEAYENVGEEIGGIVEKQAGRLADELAQGVASGNKIATVRSNLVKRLPRVSPQAREYVGDMVSLIDDIVEPSLSPAERATLGEARKQWRNFKTIEPLLEESIDGNINPTKLLNRVASSKYIRASRAGVGEDELVDLARIGKKLLPIAGGSDTFQKVATGGLLATAYFQPITAALAAGGIGLNRGFQKLYNQNPRLVQKLLQQGQKSGNYKPLVRASAKAAGRKAANEDEISNSIRNNLQRMMSDESGSVGVAATATGLGALDTAEASRPTRIDVALATPSGADPLQGTQGLPDVNIPQNLPPSPENALPAIDLPEEIPDQSILDGDQGAALTKENEGLRLSTYQDTQGNPTVGYGFNFDSGIAPKVWKLSGVARNKRLADVKAGREQITPQEAEALFRTSYEVAKSDAMRYFSDFGKLSSQQQQGLTDMSYHLGLPSLNKFKNLRIALKRGDKNAIVKALRNSEYARKFPGRAQEVATLLITDEG